MQQLRRYDELRLKYLHTRSGSWAFRTPTKIGLHAASNGSDQVKQERREGTDCNGSDTAINGLCHRLSPIPALAAHSHQPRPCTPLVPTRTAPLPVARRLPLSAPPATRHATRHPRHPPPVSRHTHARRLSHCTAAPPLSTWRSWHSWNFGLEAGSAWRADWPRTGAAGSGALWIGTRGGVDGNRLR
ncbi:hypothetical protein GGX14DRAFT_674269 [Mycena pura]|uniref:Uncharacterized protein n=1 Tax=Mycena pura TaxID=153505 RepID=A0AAD6V2L6_9AGAR|nr:hypothetical protein GGX14DRAFT_674269 [Mycena pura]